MVNLSLNVNKDSAFHILCLGAHSDDIELLGCGGTILKLIEDHPKIVSTWIVFGSSGQRTEEARISASQMLKEVIEKEIIIKEFHDGFFPYLGLDIKEYFEDLKQNLSPDLILTHYRHDLHQDHRLICELTWKTFRDHLILDYEIPKYDGDFGSPKRFSLFQVLSPCLSKTTLYI